MIYQWQRVERSVFRAYDIRGIIRPDFDENAFYSIGLGLGTRLKNFNRFEAWLARDGRLSSERLAKALKQGLLDTGIEVHELGAVATPVMYYATFESAIDSGVMVTGSHNAADYNGIKMVLAGKTLVQKDIDLLYELVNQAEFTYAKGQEFSQDLIPAYMQRILGDICLQRPLKVVVDCGNGIAGPVIPKLLQALGCEVIALYAEVDGRFPNHHPDPTVEENLQDLRKAVVENQADIGLAFDGDADRLGLITDQGTIIWPDRLMMYYAKALLKACPGATIVYDVKCSSQLATVIKEAGGVPLMSPTGHSIVKGVMKDSKAALAGEMSGHLFFKDRWYGFDDALYSACRLLELVSQRMQSVEEQFLEIPDSLSTPEIKITIDDEAKFSFMQKFCQEALFPDARLIRIDGLRVEFPYAWGILRASNTTPCLVARFEAQDEASLDLVKGHFKREIRKINCGLNLEF